MIQDPAQCALHDVVCALMDVFGPEVSVVPMGGACSEVHVFAGDALPIAAWNTYVDDGCTSGFLWVRLVRRYRTQNFPAPAVVDNTCGLSEVLTVEMGIARCALMDEAPTPQQYDEEAAISLDDSWRLSLAQCRAAALLKESECGLSTALDIVSPFGPEGGVIAWVATIHIQVS